MRRCVATIVAAALLGGACSGGGGGPAAGACGQTTCGVMQYCDFTPNTCAGGTPVCLDGPLDCLVFEKRVCGCDGRVHRSECDANGAGVDVSDTGGCTPPSGTFPCGRFFCTQGSEFCMRTISASSTVPGSAECFPLPISCGSLSICDCLVGLAGAGCTQTCAISSSGDVTSTCTLP